MDITRHMNKRMSHRGINKSIVDLVLEFGESRQDRYILGKRKAQQVIEQLQAQLASLKKISDKGGVVVVTDGESLLTTYRYEGGLK